MDCERQLAMLKRVQEMEFVAIELGLYLDTHPCDEDAIYDYNCAIDLLKKYIKEYEDQYGPLTPMAKSKVPWQWAEGPWPWEL
ncbi:spore coat protein CotJB [Sporolituus thermophilus]|uniref:Spore coat protein JB n=1 Tax=Sporolituus thermophilus DSM 23256 TaxID=1123285 RepID=A0A1G7MGW7_9FIRM|nr:spore coat protein CotJB [Sporolituus thermophilus]SDF61072.1 spore coat protein JB [Sporolituus thermophilus DSM 23256]